MTVDAAGQKLDYLYIVADGDVRSLALAGDGIIAAIIAVKLHRVYGAPMTDEQLTRLRAAEELLLGLLGEVHAEELAEDGDVAGIVVAAPPTGGLPGATSGTSPSEQRRT